MTDLHTALPPTDPDAADRRTSAIEGDTPTLRLFALLEVIAQKNRFFSLQGLADELNLPKQTLHRMLQQLESAGIVQRDGDDRQYGTGPRLRRLAEDLLLNNTTYGARHLVLSRLVEQVGESCNITALSGGEIIYLNRAETAAPLRFDLRTGSRVPIHCSATGKLFLAGMTPSQRRRLLHHMPLQAYTPRTLTDPARLEQELDTVRQQGYAMDDEEFLPGLLCIGVPVPREGGKPNLGIAIQGPIMRFPADKALACLPALRDAAQALAAIEAEAAADR